MARRRKGISPEDQAIWQRLADSTKALRAPAEKPKATEPLISVVKRQPLKITPFVLGGKSDAPKTQISLASDVLEKSSIQMDRRNFDRLRKGRLRPEAYLDLHGMTADVAHARLNEFVQAAHVSDLRLVLVITGKGRVWHDDSGVMPLRKGILRHSVPHWLAQPTLKSRILQVSQAHDKHGGGGALYVYLRRRRGAD